MSDESIINHILGASPHGAFEYSGHIFREDAYGIIKRLRFFITHIENIRQKHGIDVGEVRILDVGCGTGINISIPLATAGYDVLGIDNDHLSIEKANELTVDIDNASFICQEAETIDNRGPFHIIICSEVLEHIEDPEQLLTKMYSMLKENGVLLITVPNGYGYFELEHSIDQRFPSIASFADNIQQRLVRRFGSTALKKRHAAERSVEHCNLACSSLDSESSHCNHFTFKKIKNLIRNCGFEIAEFRNRTLFAGNIINVIIRESDTLLKWNGSIADVLPKWTCSGWMVASYRKP